MKNDKHNAETAVLENISPEVFLAHSVLKPVHLQSPLSLASPDTHELHAEGERILCYGTFAFDYARQAMRWSEGVYHLLEYPDDLRPAITPDRYRNHLHNNHPENLPLPLALNSSVRNEQETTAIYEAVTYTGAAKWIQVWAKCSYNDLGQPVAATGIIRDITGQYEQRQSARKNVEELQRSNRELEDFAYVASHDLQEPLRKINTFCGRLYARYHDQLDREGGQYIDRIMASAESMKNLIQNLLDYSRIAQTEEPLQPTRLDVLLLGVQSDLELIIEETRARIHLMPLPVVMGHAPLLTQLFTNLLSNAIKFRKSDVAPEIKITATTPTPASLAAAGLDAQGTFYCVNVVDNGIGFDPAYAERIFGLFQRLHSKAEFPGTGIGLAICRKIAERHGGTLTATGEEGEGAHFSIYFPADASLHA